MEFEAAGLHLAYLAALDLLVEEALGGAGGAERCSARASSLPLDFSVESRLRQVSPYSFFMSRSKWSHAIFSEEAGLVDQRATALGSRPEFPGYS